MVRIWAKILSDDKIVKETIFEDYSEFNINNFYDYMSTICEKLDIATPIILNKHIYHYVTFNNTTFLPVDFPESVDFDKFVIEEASNY